MLWSLIKILLFVTLTAAFAYGAGLLLEADGEIRLIAAGVEITFGPLQAALLAVAALVLVWLALRLLGLLFATLAVINGDETAISRYWNRNRERRGFEALADGMMALASGEGRLAMAKAAKAEKNLARPELTNLLSAQAAEMAGDTKKAQEAYKRLLTDDRTRFVGIRGIMKQKLVECDEDTALKLAERAFALKPRHTETSDTLLKLQGTHGDWAAARKTLGAKLKHGELPRDIHRRRDAVLALSEASELLAEGSPVEARERAIEANRLSPDLVPAAALAARSYIDQDRPKLAARILKKAWDANPHPDIAAAFAEVEPKESPSARVRRFATFTRMQATHPETRMVMAELNIAAEDFPAARKALGDLAETQPTTRSLAIMAAIERGAGAPDAVVRGWLARAVTAPRGYQWVCDNCLAVQEVWKPFCDHCGSFDTLTWRIPPNQESVVAGANDMLPLLVGQDEPAEDAPEEPDVPDAEPVEIEEAPVDTQRSDTTVNGVDVKQDEPSSEAARPAAH
ncbi:MAG: heme biosynthesis HemY N-terminal domain-containing protein [Pseudomonadota bacterium]